MKDTAIEWADHTANIWSGCTKVSPACANCYAAEMAKRFPTLGKWGPGAPRKRHTSADSFLQKLNRQSEGAERRPRVFINSLSDWLDDEAPIEWLADLLELIHGCKHLDFLLLTKRPQLWRNRMEAVMQIPRMGSHDGHCLASSWNNGYAPPNVWIGTTMEDQQRADERIPHLLDIPAKVRFLSCEPLLGPVNMTLWGLPGWDEDWKLNALTGREWASRYDDRDAPPDAARIHWVICGGESGRNARPMHPDWARSLRDQCQAAKVSFFFKQWGSWVSVYDRDIEDPDWRRCDQVQSQTPNGQWLNLAGGCGFHGDRVVRVERASKKTAGRLLDGREWHEFPTQA